MSTKEDKITLILESLEDEAWMWQAAQEDTVFHLCKRSTGWHTPEPCPAEDFEWINESICGLHLVKPVTPFSTNEWNKLAYCAKCMSEYRNQPVRFEPLRWEGVE